MGVIACSCHHDDARADTSELEQEIDRHVYALYGLMPEEIKIGVLKFGIRLEY